jgi:hypothetical protein
VPAAGRQRLPSPDLCSMRSPRYLLAWTKLGCVIGATAMGPSQERRVQQRRGSRRLPRTQNRLIHLSHDRTGPWWALPLVRPALLIAVPAVLFTVPATGPPGLRFSVDAHLPPKAAGIACLGHRSDAAQIVRALSSGLTLANTVFVLTSSGSCASSKSAPVHACSARSSSSAQTPAAAIALSRSHELDGDAEGSRAGAAPHVLSLGASRTRRAGSTRTPRPGRGCADPVWRGWQSRLGRSASPEAGGVLLLLPRVFRTTASMPTSPLAISDRPQAGPDRRRS